MKLKLKLSIIIIAVIFSGCSNAGSQNIFFQNTLSIFMLNNGKEHFICIPIQYIGEYHVSGFEFNSGSVVLGDFEIPLKRDDLIINFNKEEPSDYKFDGGTFYNQYDFYIERYLTAEEMKKIAAQYKKGNVKSNFSVWYDITIDDEKQTGCGILDDFELHNKFTQDVIWQLDHFKNFRDRYSVIEI